MLNLVQKQESKRYIKSLLLVSCVMGLLLISTEMAHSQLYSQGGWAANSMTFNRNSPITFKNPIPNYEVVDISTGQVYDGKGTYYDSYYKKANEEANKCSVACHRNFVIQPDTSYSYNVPNTNYQYKPNYPIPNSSKDIKYNYNPNYPYVNKEITRD